MKLKLYRDKVISRVRSRDLVGVYVKIDKDLWADEDTIAIPKNTKICIAEMHPKKADAIIKLWNK